MAAMVFPIVTLVLTAACGSIPAYSTSVSAITDGPNTVTVDWSVKNIGGRLLSTNCQVWLFSGETVVGHGQPLGVTIPPTLTANQSDHIPLPNPSKYSLRGTVVCGD